MRIKQYWNEIEEREDLLFVGGELPTKSQVIIINSNSNGSGLCGKLLLSFYYPGNKQKKKKCTY